MEQFSPMAKQALVKLTLCKVAGLREFIPGPIDQAGGIVPDQRGIIPRSLEYIFERIECEEGQVNSP